MGEIRVLDKTGDSKIEWDPKDKESTAKAEEEFEKKKKEGYEFFEVAEVKGKRVTKFKKSAGKLIAAPSKPKTAKQRKSGKGFGGGPKRLGSIPAGLRAAAQRELARR